MKRYNRNIYWPEWADMKIDNFLCNRNYEHISLSKHAEDKLDELSHRKREQVLKFIKNISLQLNNVFEFYIDRKKIIRKICHRSSLDKNYDIILVVSYNNKIITFYINRSNYNHNNLNPEEYERG